MIEAYPALTVGREIGPFQVVSVLGRGGMGVVYAAVDARSGERVALKTARDVEPAIVGAMRSEISSLSAIRHPGVVRVMDHGVDRGLPWYAMELLEGRTLGDFNREIWLTSDGHGSPIRTTTISTNESPIGQTTGEYPHGAFRVLGLSAGAADLQDQTRPVAAAGHLREALALYAALCAPLAHLHTRGIVHRDLKPANIFIRPNGSPVLVDFGLVSYARGTIGRESLAATAPALGTVSYVPPEQILGRFVDARADLYSLGCMLYETITGQTPFRGDNRDVLVRHLGEPPRAPSELVDGVTPDLDALVLGLLAKSPQDRIGYAADVAAALAELIGTSKPELEADYLYRPQMVGRHQLLEELLERGSRLETAHGGLVLLGGESGIGKTFLVAEFSRAERRRGHRVVTGECVPVAGGGMTMTEFSAGPLHPLRGLLNAIGDECQQGGQEVASRLLGARAALLAEYEPALAAFVDPTAGQLARGLPAPAARERVLECLTETLAAFGAASPLVLVLDDLQWADDLTLAFLASLSPAFFEARRVLVIGTYRAEDVSPELQRLLGQSTVHRLAVGRLDGGTVEAIGRDMLGMKTPPAALVDFLTTRAEGNPFFIAEYLRLLVVEGILKRRDGRWLVTEARGDHEVEYANLPVPRSLEGIVNRRLAALGEQARRVVEAAAVLGREFSIATLEVVLGLDAEVLAAALREARNKQVIEEAHDGRGRFSHDKLRETAYSSGDAARLRELHLLAAQAIERTHTGSPRFPQYFADLAHHYKAAGDAPKTIEYLDKAGGEALAKSANRDAVLFLKDAIEHAARSNVDVRALTLARWHREVSDGLQGLGRLDESATYLRRAARLLGRPAPTSRLGLILSMFAAVVRQAAHRLFPRVFLRVRRPNADALSEAARVHNRLQQVLYFSGDALAMLHACISNLNLAEMADVATDLTAAYAYAFAVAGIVPARKLAESYRRRAIEMSDYNPGEAIECNLRMLSGGYSMGVGDWGRAHDEFIRGLKVASDLGYRRGWEDCCMIDSACDYIRGRFVESLAKADALYASALRGDRQTQSWGLVQRAYVLLVHNRGDEALSSLKRAEPLVGEDQKNRVEYLWFHAVKSRALLRRGDPEGAAATADRAFARLITSPPLYFSWIEAFAALAEVFTDALQRAPADQRYELRRKARLTCTAMRAQARVFPVATPQRYLWQGKLSWELGNPRDASLCWGRALAWAKRLQMPYEEAATLQALGEAQPPHTSRRRELLEQACHGFRAVGAEYDLAQLARRAAAV